MDRTIIADSSKVVSDIPKVFWKYYDLYRRNEITLNEYAVKTKISKQEIIYYLSVI